MTIDDPTDEEVEESLDGLDLTCQLCGRETQGEASIGDQFYCHEGDGITCYMTTVTKAAREMIDRRDVRYHEETDR